MSLKSSQHTCSSRTNKPQVQLLCININTCNKGAHITLRVIFTKWTTRNSYYSTITHSEQATEIRVDSCITMRHPGTLFPRKQNV